MLNTIVFYGLLSTAFANVLYYGVNECGYEFGPIPGTYGVDYDLPLNSSVDYFLGKGMNTIRFPFMWERVQKNLNAELDAVELARMDTFINYVTSKGAMLVLDPHNSARYNGQIIGESGVTAANFADFWGKLATHYKNNNKIIFGIMNEPNEMKTETWLEDANAAIAAIRNAGATNLLLVPGNSWTGGQSWYQDWYGTPNAQVMQNISDPLDNYWYEIHQYMDVDYSGQHSTCANETIGVDGLRNVTSWLRALGKKGFLAEIAAPNTQVCLTALDNMLTFVDDNNDVWMGWTAWAAGAWWQDTYVNLLEPYANGTDRPQIPYYLKHMKSYPATFSTTGASTTGSSPSTSGSVSTTGKTTSGTTSSPSTTGKTTTSGSTTGTTATSPSSTGEVPNISTGGSTSGSTTGNTQNQEGSAATAIPLLSLLVFCVFSAL